MHKIKFFKDLKSNLSQKNGLEKLKSKFSKVEIIMELLNLIQSKLLNKGFLRCLQSLKDPENVFIG